MNTILMLISKARKDIVQTLSRFLVILLAIFFVVIAPSYNAIASECPQDISRGYYTIEGIPSFQAGGAIEIRNNKGVGLTLKAEDILEGKFDKKLNNGSYLLKVKPNTKATLSYKTLSHNFIMSEDEKPFYIDTTQLKVVPVTPKRSSSDTPKLQSPVECERRCNKSVYGFDCNCCKGGYVGECYGWVTCGAGWKETDCMKGNDDIYCRNNC